MLGLNLLDFLKRTLLGLFHLVGAYVAAKFLLRQETLAGQKKPLSVHGMIFRRSLAALGVPVTAIILRRTPNAPIMVWCRD
jgi:hypothetical protein